MSLRTRLLSAFALVTAVTVVPSLFAASRLSRLGDIAVEGRSGHAAAVNGLGQMQALVTDLDRLERGFIATGDPLLGATAAARADSLQRVYEAFRASPYGDLASELGPIVVDIGALVSDVDAGVHGGRVAEATDRFQGLLARFDLARSQYRVMSDAVDSLARGELARADAMIASARTQTLLGVGLALVLALVFTGLTTHHLTAPLRRLSRATARVADGMFEAPEDLSYDRDDEIGDLSVSFGIMTRRLAELDRTKSEFLGMVSHELKTPINVISAYVELLRDELVDVSDYHASIIRDVSDQVQSMACLVSRLMDLSRLEAGTYRLQFDSTRLRHFVADVEAHYGRLANAKGVTLATRISDDVPEEAVIDADIVRDEVLGNLIRNAIRYTPEGGRIDVSLDGDERGIRFVVADTGPGIPEEHRDLIFRKHYVADRTRAVGSGLGLAIAKEMVELHGGLIRLDEPAPSGGARFRVALPIEPIGADMEVLPPSFFGSSRAGRPPVAVA